MFNLSSTQIWFCWPRKTKFKDWEIYRPNSLNLLNTQIGGYENLVIFEKKVLKRVVNGCTFYRKDLHLICHKVPGSPSVYIAFFLSCIFFSKINSCHSSISDGKIFNLISIKFATLLWNFLYSHINKFGLLKKKNGVA